MIHSYAFFNKPTDSPEEVKGQLEDALTTALVTSFEVTLESTDVNGYRFKISVSDIPTNWTQLHTMFGTVNVHSEQRKQMGNTRVAKGLRPWRPEGKEGRFAKENPPPPWAK